MLADGGVDSSPDAAAANGGAFGNSGSGGTNVGAGGIASSSSIGGRGVGGVLGASGGGLGTSGSGGAGGLATSGGASGTRGGGGIGAGGAAVGTGGVLAATGGSSSTGGSGGASGSGGQVGTGGTVGTGGAVGTGGVVGTGGQVGGGGTGGAQVPKNCADLYINPTYWMTPHTAQYANPAIDLGSGGTTFPQGVTRTIKVTVRNHGTDTSPSSKLQLFWVDPLGTVMPQQIDVDRSVVVPGATGTADGAITESFLFTPVVSQAAINGGNLRLLAHVQFTGAPAAGCPNQTYAAEPSTDARAALRNFFVPQPPQCPDIYINPTYWTTPHVSEVANMAIDVGSQGTTFVQGQTRVIQVTVRNHGTNNSPNSRLQLYWTNPATDYAPMTQIDVDKFVVVPGSDGAGTDGPAAENFAFTPDVSVISTNGGHVALLVRVQFNSSPGTPCLAQGYFGPPDIDARSAIRNIDVVPP
jgi:hypothetical protein